MKLPRFLRRQTEVRATEWGSEHLIPSWGAASLTSSGVSVTPEGASALSAVAAAIRQPAVLAAGLPLDVYDVSQDRRIRTLSRNKWQNRLLDQPDPLIPGYQFWSDVFTHIDGFGNAYGFKYRDGGRVSEIWLLDPLRMRVDLDPQTRQRTFITLKDTGERIVIPASEIIHFRGWDAAGAPAARSPAERHRDAIGKIKARSMFEDRFVRNDARPGVILKFPREVTREQAQEYLDLWNSNYQGSANAGKAAVLGGGGDIETLPISMRDAQFIEAEQFSIGEIARIYDWLATLIGEVTTRELFVQEMARAVRLHLMPRLQRVEGTIGDDPDLFGPSSRFRPYFDVSELLRGDAATMAEVFHNLVQVGIMSRNEARIPLGLPPVEGGDEFQMTPVGGAPNPPAADGGTLAGVPPPAGIPE